jgi:Kef-type K+ transport system membrane component KefB
MTDASRSPFAQLRVWHLALLVLFVAIAIADIQNHHREERILIALAAVGYGLYGLIGWLAWRLVRRFEARIGRTRLLILYLVAMAVFFLLATVIYLSIENSYLAGRFRGWIRF